MTAQRLPEGVVQFLRHPRNAVRAFHQWTAGGGSPGVTVVTLDGQWLKVLIVGGPIRSRRILRCAAHPIDGLAGEDVQQLLKRAVAVERFPTHDVIVASPTHLCTVRLFSLPATDPKEIRDIVELQAEKHTPYAKEEILSHYRVLERHRNGYSRVLLVITHQDVIHRAVRFVEAAGLSLERVGCELEGLMNWAQLARPAPAGSSAASLVVEIDGSTTTALVMARGQAQFQRSLPIGAEQLGGDAQQSGDRLIGDLQRSIEAVESEGGGIKVQQVVLTGRVERLGEVKLRLEQGLELPVTVVAPWGQLEFSETARDSAEQLPDVSFASLVGLVSAPIELDLTPQATKVRQAFEAKARALVALACQIVAAFILIALLIVGRAQKQQRYYAALHAYYEPRAHEARQVEEALQQLEFVRVRLRQRGQLLTTLQTLAMLSPADIHWQALTYSKDESVILKGSSTDLPKVYEFQAGLSSASLFQSVEPRRVAKRPDEEGAGVDFELSCLFVGSTPLPVAGGSKRATAHP